MKTNKVHDALFGLAIGDALGVPVEFKQRAELKQNPVSDMREYGSHHQPKGTWSDDSSLAFCLADSLCIGYDIFDIANKFVQWRNAELWTPHGKVFDIGIATNTAIHNLSKYEHPSMAGGIWEEDNGNGSLMRILPLVFYIKDFDIEQRYQTIKEVSSITHAHFRSVLACFIYVELARNILLGKEKWQAYKEMQQSVQQFLIDKVFNNYEIEKYHRIFEIKIGDYELQKLYELEETEIMSSGYVVHSLEASLWCVLNANSYSETVLKAVNLGGDTDTTACIAGGLAGLIYGFENIPKHWLEVLVRKEDIMELCNNLSYKYEIQS